MSDKPPATRVMLQREIRDERPCLIVERGLMRGHCYLLPAPPGRLVIGRDPACDIAFDPNVERMVSRRHAEVEVRANGVYLVDLGSANRSRLNGEVVEGTSPLKDGDRLEFGREGPVLLVRLPASNRVPLAHPQAPAPAGGGTMVMNSPAQARKPGPDDSGFIPLKPGQGDAHAGAPAATSRTGARAEAPPAARPVSRERSPVPAEPMSPDAVRRSAPAPAADLSRPVAGPQRHSAAPPPHPVEPAAAPLPVAPVVAAARPTQQDTETSGTREKSSAGDRVPVRLQALIETGALTQAAVLLLVIGLAGLLGAIVGLREEASASSAPATATQPAPATKSAAAP